MPAARRRSKPRADHPRIYLDASALNRSFDDQRPSRNRLEAEAVLVILESVETGQVKLVGSAALIYENLKSPLVDRREYVATYLALARTFVSASPSLLDRARQIERKGIASIDALHLASAERGQATWFVTCDDRILKRARLGKLDVSVAVGTPIEFVARRRDSDDES